MRATNRPTKGGFFLFDLIYFQEKHTGWFFLVDLSGHCRYIRIINDTQGANTMKTTTHKFTGDQSRLVRLYKRKAGSKVDVCDIILSVWQIQNQLKSAVGCDPEELSFEDREHYYRALQILPELLESLEVLAAIPLNKRST